jgi:3-dehydroquinate synthase
MIEIPIDLGVRSYPIHVGHGSAALLKELLPPLGGHPVALLSNPRVFSLHGARIEKALRAVGPATRILIPDGEAYKSRETLAGVHDAMLKAGMGRDGLLLAFGGGVVTDLAGFAAATWMRGIDWVPLPTTLLAMVDSAVGGKVGINHPKAKNLIGAFHQPRAVIIDPEFLETLPLRELRSGAYEILKCGLIADRTLFKAVQQAPTGLAGWDRIALENAIASACRIKAEIVEKDEREGGLRRVLNLGHTLGHALEAVTRYRRFTHGEAVGWGLLGAAWIARGRGLLSGAAYDAIAAAVDHVGPRPRVSDIRLERVLEAMGRDKKFRGGRRVFVLPAGVGRVVIRDDVTIHEVRRALAVMAAREALID